MADIHNVKGSINRPDDTDRKKKKEIDDKQFKDLMKVKETDPEEQRKRKRQDEAMAEKRASQEMKTTDEDLQTEKDKSPAPLFSTSSSKSTPSYKSAVDPDSSTDGPYTPPPSPSTTSPYTDTTDEEDFDDISDFTEMAPLDRTTLNFSSIEEDERKEMAPGSSPQIDNKEEKPPSLKTTQTKKTTPSSTKVTKKEKSEKPKRKPTALRQKQKPEIKQKDPLEKTDSLAPPLAPLGETPSLPPSPPLELIPPIKKKKTEAAHANKEAFSTPVVDLAATQPLVTPIEGTASSLLFGGGIDSPFHKMTPEVSRLFERIGGVLTVMHLSGVTETTLHLNNPQFSQSIFFGAQVVIREFSTAPKQFNIELIGSKPAVDLFLANEQQLVAAFQTNNYNFRVHRIDTSLSATSDTETTEEKKSKQKQIKRKGQGDI